MESETLRPRILVVEDEATLRESCASVLQNDGFDVTVSGSGIEARTLLQRGDFDIVLLDRNMVHVPGMELLRVCLQVKSDALVIMMTGDPSVESSVEALRAGAWDYLPKPFTATHLQILLGRARHTLLSRRQVGHEDARNGDEHGHSRAVTLLGRSPAFLSVIRLAERVAKTDASVFLTGESGSGKEVVAQFIHHHSRRNTHPLVAVNCAALPETLLESEMFGHVKGAFTGAVRDKPGLLEAANGGTFFLDELTEMSQPIQAKLLRVIQDGVLRRVGSEAVNGKVNVRFIAATNRSPKEATEQGVLRKDLYYRLSVVPIEVPPLRQRTEDIPILASHFLSLYWKKHREKGAPLPVFTPQAIRDLQARQWLGNVRELQNAIEHAVVLLEEGSEIRPGDIPYLDSPDAGAERLAWSSALSDVQDFEGEYRVVRERVLEEFEMQYLSNLIRRAGANMSRAAKMAGVDRTTLYRLMEKHGLQRDTVIKAN